jgi:hypothetical protein
MSVQIGLQAALTGALRDHAPLGTLTGVFDAPPVRAALPYAVVGEAVLADWSTKDTKGREARVAVMLHDGGERPARLRLLAGEVETAIAAMPRDLGDGWRIVSLAFVRSRIVPNGAGRWIATSEYRVRMLESGGN